MYFIHTIFSSCIYTNKKVYVYMFVYILVQTMYIPCTYMARTIPRCYEQEIQKGKTLRRSGFEPTILCIPGGFLNQYTTSVLV